MSERRKYLFLAITEGFAGAEHFLVDYFSFIDHKKYSVTLGVKKDVFGPSLKKNNLPVELTSLPELDERDSFFTKLRSYYKLFVTISPHCIVFNQYWLKSFTLAEIIAACIATRGNAYMIVHDCPPVFPRHPSKLRFGFMPDFGLPWKLRRLFQTLLGYFTKNTIAVSRAARDTLVGLHHFPSHKVKIVYHGVDVCTYSPSQDNRTRLRQQFEIPSSHTLIVSTAMLWPVKCVDRLVKAFAVVSETRKDLHLIVAGTGSEHKGLIDMTKSFDKAIQNRVRFLGYRSDIPHLLQSSDIYVLPSDSEGLPLACLEAMSSGLISIVTDCGGTAEIIQDGYNGFLVEKSEEGVLQGLRKVLALSDEEKKEISQNSRKFIEQYFDLEKNIASGLGVLQLNHG